jgi:hypothetical protein
VAGSSRAPRAPRAVVRQPGDAQLKNMGPSGSELVYMSCAAAGGTVLVVQAALSMLGLDDAHDAGHGADGALGAHEADHGLPLLSLRAIAAFLTFFGLGGWWADARGLAPMWSAPIGFSAGASTMLLVAWIVRAQRRLNSEGTLELARAVGLHARVYLRVPAARSGQGKVSVMLQGRSAELSAWTDGPELPTGAQVRIDQQLGPDVFLVSRLPAGAEPHAAAATGGSAPA